MRWRSRVSIYVFFFSSYAAILEPASADPIKEPWQSQREAAIELGNRACAGDERAISEVRRGIARGDPVLMTNVVSLQAKCDAFDSFSEDAVIGFQRRAAEAGYPIALSNYGIRLIKGWGVPVDTKQGARLMARAVEGGNGYAAAVLAHEYASGEFLKRNLSKAGAFLKIAEQEGASADRIATAREQIASANLAIGEERRASLWSTAPPPPTATSETTEENRNVAALVISNWAYDNRPIYEKGKKDGKAIADSLRKLEHDVRLLENLSAADLLSNFEDFLKEFQDARATIIYLIADGFYLAQEDVVAGTDFNEFDKKGRGKSLISTRCFVDALMARSSPSLMILNTSRTNPWKRVGTPEAEAPCPFPNSGNTSGPISIIYSTQEDAWNFTSESEISTFGEALKAELDSAVSGSSFSFDRLSENVASETDRQQIPMLQSISESFPLRLLGAASNPDQLSAIWLPTDPSSFGTGITPSPTGAQQKSFDTWLYN